MMNKLKTRVILLILGATIFSILLVSIITNITLFNKFDNYMKSDQQNKVNEVIELVKRSYSVNDGWTRESLEYMKTSPLIRDFDIVIRDNSHDVIFASRMATMMENHMDMMRRMGNNMMMRRPQNDYNENQDYRVERHELELDGEKIGEIELGHIGPFTITEREIEFTRSINHSIIYASIFAVFIAILLGIYFSRIITTPILKINKASNYIRKGKLDVRIEENNKITEIKELSNSINHLAISLQEQQQLRKRLTSDISHELRTPLTILQSHIEAMLDGIWEPTNERLSIFKGEVDRLIKLVAQLKDLVDIESHKIVIEKERFDLSKVLNNTIESFSYKFNSENIGVDTDIDKEIYLDGDKDKISQIFINIISNALKFTDSGGSVKVRTTDGKDKVKIEIEDTGIGISEEDLPYIFERLYRSDKSRNRETGGAGIGLTITKKLVEAHNGKIEVESIKDKGTKFTITLPKNNS